MDSLMQSARLQLGGLSADDPEFEGEWARRLSTALASVSGQGPHAELQKGIAALNLTRLALRSHPALETEARSLDWLLMELLNASKGIKSFNQRYGTEIAEITENTN